MASDQDRDVPGVRRDIPANTRGSSARSGQTSLEICVDDMAGFEAAQLDQVERIELCAALDLGGLTPSGGFLAQARRSRVPVFVMIRPRAGNFIFSPADIAQMENDIALVREAGMDGVVLGAALEDGTLDYALLERLSLACGSLHRQLHRVFDLTPDPIAALDMAMDLGFERVLTSGQAVRAPDGAACLRRLNDHARGRIDIMAGSAVRPDNVGDLIASSGVKSFHASCRIKSAVQDGRLDHFGFAASHAVTSSAEILRLHEAIRTACPE